MKYVSLLAILLCAGLLVACSSSDAPANTDTKTEHADDADDHAADEGTTPETPVAATDAKTAFAAAFANPALEYTVAYDMTADADGQTVSTQTTQYMNAKDEDNYQFRIDSAYGGIETQTFIVGDVYTSCTKMSGKWSCFSPEVSETETEEQPESAQDEAASYAEDDTSTVVRDGSMQVAGVTADCFLVTVDDGSTRYCIYQTVPLYVKTMDKSGNTVSELKATSFKKSTEESDFVPPAKPSAMPSYGGAAGTYPEGYEMPEGFDPSDYAAK